MSDKEQCDKTLSVPGCSGSFRCECLAGHEGMHQTTILWKDTDGLPKAVKKALKS